MRTSGERNPSYITISHSHFSYPNSYKLNDQFGLIKHYNNKYNVYNHNSALYITNQKSERIRRHEYYLYVLEYTTAHNHFRQPYSIYLIECHISTYPPPLNQQSKYQLADGIGLQYYSLDEVSVSMTTKEQHSSSEVDIRVLQEVQIRNSHIQYVGIRVLRADDVPKLR